MLRILNKKWIILYYISNKIGDIVKMRKYRILTIVLFIILTVTVIGCDKDQNQKLNFLSDAESAINDGNYE